MTVNGKQVFLDGEMVGVADVAGAESEPGKLTVHVGRMFLYREKMPQLPEGLITPELRYTTWLFTVGEYEDLAIQSWKVGAFLTDDGVHILEGVVLGKTTD